MLAALYVCIAGGSLILPRNWLLLLVAATGVLQLFIPGAPVAGYFPSLVLVASVRFFLDLVVGPRPSWAAPFYLAVLLAVWYAVCLVWSPQPAEGIRNIVLALVFAVLWHSGCVAGWRGGLRVRRILGPAFFLSSVEALLVAAFRLSPALEGMYLHSSVATYLENPNTMSVLFTTAPDNVLDPAKAGGVFLNANVAGAYLGTMAFIALGWGLGCRKKSYIAAAALMWAATFFTGSKAAIVAAVALPTIFVGYLAVRGARFGRRGRTVVRRAAVGAFIGTVCVSAILIASYGSMSQVHSGGVAPAGFISRVGTTLAVRERIWSYGAHEFAEAPLQGLGFGGWERRFEPWASAEGINGSFPPHNSLLYLWSQAGLAGLALGLALVFSMLRENLTLLRSGSGQLRWIGLCQGLGILWLFLQAMGENYPLFGESRTVFLLAIALGLSFGTYLRWRRGAGGPELAQFEGEPRQATEPGLISAIGRGP